MRFNHTIIWASDKYATATWWEHIFGVSSRPMGPFLQVTCENGVDLDICSIDTNTGADTPASQHYAFLVSEKEFDQILDRVQAKGITFHSNPDGSGIGETNTTDGGRGVYFEDPNGHGLEIITVPYGGWPQT